MKLRRQRSACQPPENWRSAAGRVRGVALGWDRSGDELNSQLTGIKTGNLERFDRSRPRAARRKYHDYKILWDEFPAHRNRELIRRNREFVFQYPSETGNLQRVEAMRALRSQIAAKKCVFAQNTTPG
jgi:hypothetical protein